MGFRCNQPILSQAERLKNGPVLASYRVPPKFPFRFRSGSRIEAVVIPELTCSADRPLKDAPKSLSGVVGHSTRNIAAGAIRRMAGCPG